MNQPPIGEINIHMVQELVISQFPKWSELEITPVAKSGRNNRMFHLGRKMLVRLPSAPGYEHQVKKEQEWLPKLAPQLSMAIPKPLALGRPTELYRLNWSIYQWIEGENAETLDSTFYNEFAVDIAEFLNQLASLDSSDGPIPDRSYRGAPVIFYNDETLSNLSKLKGLIDADFGREIWEEAIGNQWKNKPVWLHGDFSPGNILVKDNRLTAVIDFGCMAVGDPSCDLVIAWTMLNKESRKLFRNHLSYDSDTWARARGWALWKALFELDLLKDKQSPEAMEEIRRIEEIFSDYQNQA